MAAPVTAAELANFEPKLINPARFTLQHRTLAKGLMRNEPLKPHMGRTLNTPKYGVMEAFDAEEGVEIDNPQALTSINIPITPTEIIGQFMLTDKAVRTSGENQIKNGGRILGDAMKLKLDRKGLAMFTTYTTHALGSITTALTAGHVTAAAALLEGNSEPTPDPIYCVLRPEQMRFLLNALAPTGTYPLPTGLSQEIVTQYLKHDGKVFGLDGIFQSGNILRTTASPKSAVGAVFSKEATLYVPADDMNVEKDRRMKARAWLFQTSHEFAFGHYNELWGVNMTFTADDPTA